MHNSDSRMGGKVQTLKPVALSELEQVVVLVVSRSMVPLAEADSTET
jgi:hypothetical protein